MITLLANYPGNFINKIHHQPAFKANNSALDTFSGSNNHAIPYSLSFGNSDNKTYRKKIHSSAKNDIRNKENSEKDIDREKRIDSLTRQIIIGDRTYVVSWHAQDKGRFRSHGIPMKNIIKALTEGKIYNDREHPDEIVYACKYEPYGYEDKSSNSSGTKDDYIFVPVKDISNEIPYRNCHTNNLFMIKTVFIVEGRRMSNKTNPDNEFARYKENTDLYDARKLWLNEIRGLDINYKPKSEIVINTKMPPLSIGRDNFVFEKGACEGVDIKLKDILQGLHYGEIYKDSYQGQIYDKGMEDKIYKGPYDLIVYRFKLPSSNKKEDKFIFIGVCESDVLNRYIINKVMISSNDCSGRYKERRNDLEQRRANYQHKN